MADKLTLLKSDLKNAGKEKSGQDVFSNHTYVAASLRCSSFATTQSPHYATGPIKRKG
jgi:hypothetical protein